MESVEEEDASSEGATRRQAGVASLFAVAVAGFSCLIGWELSAVFSPSLPLLSFCDIQTAIFIRCISVLTLAFAFGFFAVKADLFFKNRDRLAVAALIVSFLPMICACAYTATGALPIIVLEISWALLGISQAILATYWCVIFSLMESSFTMRVVVSGGVGGTFLFVIVNAAGELWVSMLELCLILFISVLSAAMIARSIPKSSIPNVQDFRRVPDLSAPAFFSVASCGAVYGLMSIEVCYQGFMAALVGGASGIFGVALAVVWCVLGSRVDIDVGVVQRIALPLLVVSLLMMPLFEGPLRVIWACVALATLAHNQMFTWFSVSIENYEFRLHPVRRFALRQIPSWVGFFIGCLLAYAAAFVFRLDSESLYLFTCVFVVVIVVAFSVYGGDESKTKRRLDSLIDVAAQKAIEAVSKPEEVEVIPSASTCDGGEPFCSEGFQDRCEEVSRKYSLTPRETEVFALLAKGRNAEYIAGQLMVTPATIKSHIYHIYQKLGVNSQQRLMDLVDEGKR